MRMGSRGSAGDLDLLMVLVDQVAACLKGKRKHGRLYHALPTASFVQTCSIGGSQTAQAARAAQALRLESRAPTVLES
jgi:hypothetical protein